LSILQRGGRGKARQSKVEGTSCATAQYGLGIEKEPQFAKITNAKRKLFEKLKVTGSNRGVRGKFKHSSTGTGVVGGTWKGTDRQIQSEGDSKAVHDLK